MDVLPPAGNDDDDNSDEPADDAAPAPAPAPAPAYAAAAAAGGGGEGDAGGGGAAAAAGPRSSSAAAAAAVACIAPADAAAAALYAAAAAAGIEEMPDLNDFTTWHPGTWGDLEFDKSPIPADPNTSICSVRSYLAQAMIMWYDTAVGERNACGTGSMRLGRPPFTPHLLLVLWRHGLQTDHTASPRPNLPG